MPIADGNYHRQHCMLQVQCQDAVMLIAREDNAMVSPSL